MSTYPSEKRLLKELRFFVDEPPEGMCVDGEETEQNLKLWIVYMNGAEGTLFEGEKFKLQFKFDGTYPFEAPEVTFVGDNIPVHPHIYSNGHICLSILSDDWSPALTVQAICVSIISMLSSCKRKERPEDDRKYIRSLRDKDPTYTKWNFYNDKI
ncbi:ubiquitin-conjugating enzyme E2 W-like [Acyrthosiphon pisum]|uniref:N-terminal E2 ubiquitin-conjugating enzyme n=1 Tax=Acyrthosiphon pisum TaxID=7029 RepID=A0A8R1W168_ACYPI|nr:ubiquitin-conjugating enzyme E2 W-like [Acyrthosiphon pisum]|eukprot:XP_001944563.1 PREDICTED: ubiquitin-conjugating enzyme E2 W-like [Acyrthosiphon pisum]